MYNSQIKNLKKRFKAAYEKQLLLLFRFLFSSRLPIPLKLPRMVFTVEVCKLYQSKLSFYIFFKLVFLPFDLFSLKRNLTIPSFFLFLRHLVKIFLLCMLFLFMLLFYLWDFAERNFSFVGKKLTD